MNNETKRDRAAEEYASRYAPGGLLCPTRLYGFIAGWDARDEEVNSLREENERLKADKEFLHKRRGELCIQIDNAIRNKIDEWVEFLSAAIKSERGNLLSDFGEGAQDARVQFLSFLKEEKRKLRAASEPASDGKCNVVDEK